MSITAVVTNYVKFSGDQAFDLPFASADLENSPAMQEVVTLSAGNNTITVPDIDDFVVHGLAIVPPSLNDIEIVLKGVSGDTGLTLSATEVSVFQLGETPPASLVLNVASELVGLRLIWF